MLSGDQLNRLINSGMTSEQMKLVAEIMVESEEKERNATVTKRNESVTDRNGVTRNVTRNALRQKRYRFNKKIKEIQHESVTARNVTRNAPPIDSDLTSLFPLENNKESKKVSLLTKMIFVTLPDEWKNWAMNELGWTSEIAQDTFQLFYEYWANGKGKSTKREKWGATWRTWCRNQTTRMRTPTPNSRFNQGSSDEDPAVRMARINAKAAARGANT